MSSAAKYFSLFLKLMTYPKIHLLIALITGLFSTSILYGDNGSPVTFSPYSDTIPASTVSAAGIDSIFFFILKQADVIDFDDCNICKSRAHIISRLIQKYYPGVTVGKVWLIADPKRSSMRETYRYKPEILLKGKGSCGSWKYHVAPVIITLTDTIVMDPATQTKPVILSDWYKSIIDEGGKGFLIIKQHDWYRLPDDDAGYFSDEIKQWPAANEDLHDDAYLKSIDETMHAKNGFYEPWKFKIYMQKLLELVK
jgi:hypothetical protein